VLWIIYKKAKKFDGQIILLYCSWYGLGRMVFEGLRTDSLILFANIRVSQLIAFLTLVISLSLLIFMYIKNRKSKIFEQADSMEEYINGSDS